MVEGSDNHEALEALSKRVGLAVEPFNPFKEKKKEEPCGAESEQEGKSFVYLLQQFISTEKSTRITMGDCSEEDEEEDNESEMSCGEKDMDKKETKREEDCKSE